MAHVTEVLRLKGCVLLFIPVNIYPMQLMKKLNKMAAFSHDIALFTNYGKYCMIKSLL